MNRVEIRSAVRGRERWQIDRLRSRPRYAAAVERSLSGLPAVRHVWANPLTGRLLLVYDPALHRNELHDRVHATLGITPVEPEELRDWRGQWPRGYTSLPQELAVDQARLRLIMSGTLFAGVLAKRVLFGAGAFAASPAFATASAIMTIITGYTALRRGMDVIAGGGMFARTLLTTVTLGILVASESLDGIGALVAAHAGELLEMKSIAATRGAVQVLDTWWEPHRVPVSPVLAPEQDRFELFSAAALVASGGALLATGDPQQSLAMLVGACPVAGPESRITARALSLHRAIDAGILFRSEDTISSLPRKAALVFTGPAALQQTSSSYGRALRAAGARRTLLLSSAPTKSVAAVARGAGINEWRGKLDVHKKVDILDGLRAAGFSPVVVAGDEEGDPALLAAADAGIAVVTRSAPETLHAAGVLVMEADPRSVVVALDLMRRTSAIVREDEWLSRLAGIVGFTAAALGKLPLPGAQRLHNYTRLAMELNSLRLLSPGRQHWR